jgi:hypothetical protein
VLPVDMTGLLPAVMGHGLADCECAARTVAKKAGR